jgi:hypothetical protein
MKAEPAFTSSTIEFSGSVSAIKTRGSMRFEMDAIAWRELWPDWLSVVLELNYLAEPATSRRPLSSIAPARCTVAGLLGELRTVLRSSFQGEVATTGEGDADAPA